MSTWLLDSDLLTFLLYDKTSYICNEAWNLAFINFQYACAMQTFANEFSWKILLRLQIVMCRLTQ